MYIFSLNCVQYFGQQSIIELFIMLYTAATLIATWSYTVFIVFLLMVIDRLIGWDRTISDLSAFVMSVK